MDVLEGELVRLRPFREEDYAYFAALKNDLRTQAWNQRQPPDRTPAAIRERFEEVIKNPLAGLFAVETKDGRLAGDIQYHEGPPRLSATIGIMFGLEFWGRGLAHEAHELLLEFLFVERGLQVVRLWTHSGNGRMVGSARKLGYQVSVRLRDNAIIGGVAVDTLMMDQLREEYFERRGVEVPIRRVADAPTS
jgi:RimJ/RimL family protein N-acetyltransferase